LCVVIWHHPVPRNEQGDAKMAEINFHPDDREMSTLELAKNLGIVVSVLSVFEVMFYAMFLEGQVLMPVLCGFPLGLILVALLWQCAMHFLGYGTMVMNGNEIVLRTPRSGKRSKSILDPLARVVLAPMAKMYMRDMDKDGDGRLSLEEVLDEMDDLSKAEYAEIRKLFDRYDEDGDGYISLKEMEEFIKHSEDNWAEDEEPGNWWSDDGN
ncbi:MAG: EF-hand domain-containing protein, partial [Candidatus Thermoplasmatota archaeon]|nr:EF-hand domain-containing protein [Candidatus Thermoplasmatota archaeon]